MTSASSAFDAHMMAIALRMAARGLGSTAPNPSVGAVIAREATREVIARATTAPGGRPHAETIAIAAAGAKASGATMYVTLEPCSHTGHTGPCADAIISAGISRVVVAIEDPDPRVAGRGLDKLRAAGLEVVRGLGADEARYLTRGHIVRTTERRPFVTLKLAFDSHGEIARGTGTKPVWVTGEFSRAHGMLLRARADAILAGSATVRDDDPQLTCRLPGLMARSPARIILSGALDIPVASKLVQTARDVPTWVMISDAAAAGKRDAFESVGVHIIPVATVGGRLWLPAVMEALVARGITRLLVEGGPVVWRSFADAALVDEVVLYMAGTPSDSDAAATIARWLGAIRLETLERSVIGTDTMWRMRRVAAREGQASCSPA